MPLEIEIDGKQMEVPDGSTIMDATNQAGIYVPHFCYHRKLSIAANCRMCLVHVDKAPKPLPACATPVTNGMITVPKGAGLGTKLDPKVLQREDATVRRTTAKDV